MNTIEIFASALGVINVALIIRRSVWNYPFGILMVILYARIFFDAKLYSDAALQLFFLVVQLYGWFNWSSSRAQSGEVRVERLANRTRLLIPVAVALSVGAWGAIMYRFTDAANPWWDASIAGMSVAAQILMARRYIENWILWIAVDVLAIGLFAQRGLQLTAGLYGLFLLMAMGGLVTWARARRRPAA